MTAFDAAEIARDVGELYEPVADEKGLALHVDAASPAPVRGNRELIGQALANLLDNAIKYAGAATDRAAGTPRRSSSRRRPEGDQIMLGVGDRGPGIPPADRSRAVERFVRLEQSRTEPGSGLGLSLASAVARLHGGELRLEDNAPGLRALADPAAGGCCARDELTWPKAVNPSFWMSPSRLWRGGLCARRCWPIRPPRAPPWPSGWNRSAPPPPAERSRG